MFLLKATAYNVNVNREGPFPQTVSFAVSHALPSQGADQIQLDFGATPPQAFEEIYHVIIRIRYNETNWTEPITLILVMPEAHGEEPPYFYEDFVKMRETFTPTRYLKSGEESLLYKVFGGDALVAPKIDEYNRRVLNEVAAQAPTARLTRA